MKHEAIWHSEWCMVRLLYRRRWLFQVSPEEADRLHGLAQTHLRARSQATCRCEPLPGDKLASL